MQQLARLSVFAGMAVEHDEEEEQEGPEVETLHQQARMEALMTATMAETAAMAEALGRAKEDGEPVMAAGGDSAPESDGPVAVAGVTRAQEGSGSIMLQEDGGPVTAAAAAAFVR